MKLSVIVPSIRPNNLIKLYKSVLLSFSQDFEMIVIGPFMDFEFKSAHNVQNIKSILSWRSPNACQQQGLLEAKGEYVTFCSDDGEYLPHTLDAAINAIELANADGNYKTVIVGKYTEGDNPIGMVSQDYYRFKYHKPYRLAGINPEWLIFNCGLISNKFIRELGGWDSENFETTTCAHADLGIRAQKAGAKMLLMPDVMFKCSHQPGKSGDHGPVHYAMIKRDLPKFQEIYKKPNDRINIELNKWQYTPEVWSERFK